MGKNLNLVWLDLEMTGLIPRSDRIIEIATLVTDPALNILAEGPVFAIKQPDEVLNAMDEWNQKHHGISGLILIPLDIVVPFSSGFKKDLTYKGISFF